MAENAPNGIKYYLHVPIENLDHLARLREWSNLKMAFDKESVWITNFELIQLDSVWVKSIPIKTIFYSQNGKLFLLNSLLPDRKEPTFLWTPIERALPLHIEKYNTNYFGIEEQLDICIIPSAVQSHAEVMYIALETLENYVLAAPEIRLSKLNWVVVDEKFALLFGTPLLPPSSPFC